MTNSYNSPFLLQCHTMKISQNKKPSQPKTSLIKGRIRVAGKALGFVEIDGKDEDILIETENLNTALNNDEVEIALLKKHGARRQTGKVLTVLKRAKSQFVGTLEKDKERFFLIPDDKKVYSDIVVGGNEIAEKANFTTIKNCRIVEGCSTVAIKDSIYKDLTTNKITR